MNKPPVIVWIYCVINIPSSIDNSNKEFFLMIEFLHNNGFDANLIYKTLRSKIFQYLINLVYLFDVNEVKKGDFQFFSNKGCYLFHHRLRLFVIDLFYYSNIDSG